MLQTSGALSLPILERDIHFYSCFGSVFKAGMTSELWDNCLELQLRCKPTSQLFPLMKIFETILNKGAAPHWAH